MDPAWCLRLSSSFVRTSKQRLESSSGTSNTSRCDTSSPLSLTSVSRSFMRSLASAERLRRRFRIVREMLDDDFTRRARFHVFEDDPFVEAELHVDLDGIRVSAGTLDEPAFREFLDRDRRAPRRRG